MDSKRPDDFVRRLYNEMDKEYKRKMTTSELIEQVGVWADNNFGTVEMGRRIPHYGLLEEVGEAIHCILKHTQKIRGYEVEEFFQKELQDAFADSIIYLADYAHIHKAFFQFHGVKPESIDYLRSKGEELIIGKITQCISSIMHYECQMAATPGITETTVYCMMCQGFCSTMEIWAAYHGYNLQSLVWFTWGKVSQRNWNRESMKGGE